MEIKIGFDAKRLYNNFTGLGNYGRNLLLNLAEFYPENQYHLYTPKIRPSSETEVFLQNKSFITHQPQGFKPLWRSLGISRELDKDQLDIYHGLSNELPFGKSEAKKVVTIHDLIFKIYPETYKPADRLIYNTKFEYACKKADRVVAISQQTKEDIIRFYKIPEQKISVVYQSCHPLFYQQQSIFQLEEVKQRLRLPERFLLSVGSVIERKNLMLVAQALNQIKDQTDIPLVVVGSGGVYQEKVKQYLEQNNLSDRVIWLNKLKSNTDLQALYQLSTVFVYPSVYEGFGIPLVEAMLSGVPVITSNVSCLPETLGEKGLTVDPLNPEDLAAQLHGLISDEEKRRAIAIDALSFALEKYSRKNLSAAQMEIYHQLMA